MRRGLYLNSLNLLRRAGASLEQEDEFYIKLGDDKEQPLGRISFGSVGKLILVDGKANPVTFVLECPAYPFPRLDLAMGRR